MQADSRLALRAFRACASQQLPIVGLHVSHPGYKSDVATLGRASFWHAVDRVLAPLFCVQQVLKYIYGCFVFAYDETESCIFPLGFMLASLCFMRSMAAVRGARKGGFFFWHTLWHFTLPTTCAVFLGYRHHIKPAFVCSWCQPAALRPTARVGLFPSARILCLLWLLLGWCFWQRVLYRFSIADVIDSAMEDIEMGRPISPQKLQATTFPEYAADVGGVFLEPSESCEQCTPLVDGSPCLQSNTSRSVASNIQHRDGAHASSNDDGDE